jgi:hypothetical protein
MVNAAIITPVQVKRAVRKGVRVVDGNGLENRRASNGTVGSNPTPSAKLKYALQYADIYAAAQFEMKQEHRNETVLKVRRSEEQIGSLKMCSRVNVWRGTQVA